MTTKVNWQNDLFGPSSCALIRFLQKRGPDVKKAEGGTLASLPFRKNQWGYGKQQVGQTGESIVGVGPLAFDASWVIIFIISWLKIR